MPRRPDSARLSRQLTRVDTSGLVGHRVSIHPKFDLWMRGARHGEITKVTKAKIYIKLDATGKVHPFPRDGSIVRLDGDPVTTRDGSIVRLDGDSDRRPSWDRSRW